VSDGSGTRVTAESVDDPGDLVTDGDCYVAGIQVYAKSGTHVITVKNVGGGPR
jgi:hypothetical protein